MAEDNDKIRLITTDDGSHSLFVPAMNETYHSFHGAVQESRHVFIKMGLSYLLDAGHIGPINIFEVGFGTGLNALLTADFAVKNNIEIHFTTIEAYPIDNSLVTELNYSSFLTEPIAPQWFKKLHDSAWEIESEIHPSFFLKKVKARLEDYCFGNNIYDIIFFDAFAPNKQAELWDLQILNKIAMAMGEQAVFVTYCAKGQLKRDLHSLNLKVDTLPGPPGKKEMVRAVKS